MGATSPESLSTAGGFLVAAGVVAALVGGLYGLQTFRPGLVVLSVLLAMGYGAAGYMLQSRRDAAFAPAAALAGGLAVATLVLFQAGVATLFGATFTHLVLFPLLAALLALAAAHLVAYGVARRRGRVRWPRGSAPGVAAPLQLAALAPIVGVFVLTYVDPARNLGTPGAHTAIAFGIVAAVASASGGVLASVKRPPHLALAGGGVGFLANAVLLFAFAEMGTRAYTGQLFALAGLLLAAYPLVASALAWMDLNQAAKKTPDRSEPVHAAPDARERAP